MALNARGQAVLPGTSVSRESIENLLMGVIDIRPVANTTARGQLLAALTAAGYPASPEYPLFVRQADTGRVTVHDGTVWKNLAVPEFLEGGAPAGGATVDSKVLVTVNIAAVPYARRVVMNGAIYAGAIAGQWDGAMSLGASSVTDAQRLARFPTSGSASVALSLSETLAANTASTARLWVSRVSAAGTGASITASGSTKYTNLDIQMFQTS